MSSDTPSTVLSFQDRTLDTVDKALDRGPLFIAVTAPITIAALAGSAYVLGVTARETGKAVVGVVQAINPFRFLRR